MPGKTKLIITVGCEYGCQGPEIAQRLADDLGIPCSDRGLVDDIIEEAGFSKDLLDKAEKGHAIRGRDTGDVDPKKLGAIRYHNLTDRVVFLQRETVPRLAARGSCAFAGRCAHHILRHADVKTLNVFIYAPSDVRLATVMKEHNLNKNEAKLLIDKSDEDLHARYKQVTGTYRGDRHNRHMLIDSSLLGAERTAELIERLAFAHFGSAGAADVDTSTASTAQEAAPISSAPDHPPVLA